MSGAVRRKVDRGDVRRRMDRIMKISQKQHQKQN